MMTISDYINMLRLYRRQALPLLDLAAKSIEEMLMSSVPVFKHSDFETVDAEDSVLQLCRLMHRLGTDYVPVVDPDEGNLVSILSYLDLVHLLHEAAKQYPHFFSSTLRQMGIGTFENVVSAPQSALLFDVIEVLEERNISGIPVINEQGLVVGLYHKSDVSFITKSADPDSAILELHSLLVGEALRMQQTHISHEASTSTTQGDQPSLSSCTMQDPLAAVLDTMMRAQATRLVCVDGGGRCLGVVSIKDILWYYFDDGTER
jgi:5'-AMP-activated protein kinase regulatory gamma subunit